MGAVIQQSIGCVLTLLLIGLVGYVLARKGWIHSSTRTLWPKLVTVVALPPFLFSNILDTFNRDDLIHLLYGCLVPTGSIVLTFFFCSMLARILKIRRERRGIFASGSALSNTMLIGLAVNLALFGEAALPFVLLYFFVNTSFFWTVANIRLSRDGDLEAPAIFSRATLKRVFSPPWTAFLIGVACTLFSWRPPEFVMDAARYVGGMTTPLSIIFVGLGLAAVKLRELKIDRDVVFVLLGRFVVSPLMVLLMASFFDLPPLMIKVFIIQSSMPVSTAVALLSAYYRSDYEYASVIISLSTILSILTLPVYMVFLELYFGAGA